MRRKRTWIDWGPVHPGRVCRAGCGAVATQGGGGMTAHPILFTGEMVRAILAGSKTQTRRVIKPQPHIEGTVRRFSDGVTDLWGSDAGGFGHCRIGQPGDLLWVRETWCLVNDTEFGGEQWVDYRATPSDSAEHPAGWQNAPDDEEALKWKPSIHMPRKYSRLTLRVSNVRVERVQDISESDALEEGIEQINEAPVPGHFDYRAREKFSGLWDSINEKRGYSWESNPWVWVIDWDKVWTQNVDEVAG